MFHKRFVFALAVVGLVGFVVTPSARQPAVGSDAPQAGGGGQGRGGAGGGPTPSIEDRTSGMRKLDGYFPLYWDERGGQMWLEISRFDTPFLYTTGLSAGLGSNDIGLDRGSEGGGRTGVVPARRSEDHARPAEPVVPVEQPESARAQVRRRLVRQVDPMGHDGRGRVRQSCARRRDAVLPARRDGRGRIATAGRVPRRPDAKRLLHAQHAQLPEEHRARHDADVHQRRRGRRARRRRRCRRTVAGTAGHRHRQRRGGGRRGRRRPRRRPLLRHGRERVAGG